MYYGRIGTRQKCTRQLALAAYALTCIYTRASLLPPKALRTAQLEDFVRGLPEGLDAPVSQEVREASELAVVV